MFKKNTYLCFLAVFIFNSCHKSDGALSCEQTYLPADKYVYKFKPGVQGWDTLNSLIKQKQALQIPQDTLDKYSTGAIIQALIDYPLASQIFARSPQSGYLAMYDSFSGFIELKKRKDAAETAIARYSKMQPTCFQNFGTDFEKQYFAVSFAYLELFLSQDMVLNTLNLSSQKALTGAALFMYDRKKEHDYYFGQFLYVINLSLCARIMKSANYQPFIAILNNSTNIKTLLEFATYSPILGDDDPEIKEVIRQAREFAK